MTTIFSADSIECRDGVDQIKRSFPIRLVVGALSLSLVSGEALAISRYNSQSMTCDSIQAIIQREGAAILRYASTRTPGLPLYDRYVADGTYCSYGESAEVTSVPARDTPSCLVLSCKEITYSEPGSG
ncbi:MAG TPA: hypothetical protein VNS34_01065 [Rhizobiaceae bacterium]|nr:hypothetical protein [Rhizobiaceae bacterium]